MVTLENKIAAIWEDEASSPFTDFEIKIKKVKNHFDVTISQMYEFVPANFTHMKALSELFGTDDINMNNWSYAGCETCDWGSNYSVQFDIKNATKELE
jgi:hypothetical protein